MRRGLTVHRHHLNGHLLGRRRVQAHGEVQLAGRLAGLGVLNRERQVVVMDRATHGGHVVARDLGKRPEYGRVPRAIENLGRDGPGGLDGRVVVDGNRQRGVGRAGGERDRRRGRARDHVALLGHANVDRQRHVARIAVEVEALRGLVAIARVVGVQRRSGR